MHATWPAHPILLDLIIRIIFGEEFSSSPVHKRIIEAVKRVEHINDGMSYIMLRGRWCGIIALNVHAPAEDKTDDNVTRLSDYRRGLDW
jgi:hypothetical protein